MNKVNITSKTEMSIPSGNFSIKELMAENAGLKYATANARIIVLLEDGVITKADIRHASARGRPTQLYTFVPEDQRASTESKVIDVMNVESDEHGEMPQTNSVEHEDDTPVITVETSEMVEA